MLHFHTRHIATALLAEPLSTVGMFAMFGQEITREALAEVMGSARQYDYGFDGHFWFANASRHPTFDRAREEDRLTTFEETFRSMLVSAPDRWTWDACLAEALDSVATAG